MQGRGGVNPSPGTGDSRGLFDKNLTLCSTRSEAKRLGGLRYGMEKDIGGALLRAFLSLYQLLFAFLKLFSDCL